MRYLDLTFPTPQENLACDEALLEGCEAETLEEEILRVWEPREIFVVLGRSSRIREEVDLAACQACRVPVLRRISGGGTVLQGPGCLNFSLFLNIDGRPALRNVTETNVFILRRHCGILESLLKKPVAHQGLTDLTVGTLKVSGNAQRRMRRTVLFHGTFLLNLEFRLIHRLLPVPTRQPSYRDSRPHADFLMNLSLDAGVVQEALRSEWQALEPLSARQIPSDWIQQLATDRYLRDSWTYRF